MARPPAGTIQVSVRVPIEWWERRVEAIAERIAADGGDASKASVLRAALRLGLETLETRHGIKPKGKRT
jgi:hypothetical protein